MEDRCKRIADRRYSKPSAYKSGAIVRCRKGDIWKDIKSEAFFIGEDGDKIDYYTDRNGNKFQTIDINYLQYPGKVMVKYDNTDEPVEYKGNFEADLKSDIIRYLNSGLNELGIAGVPVGGTATTTTQTTAGGSTNVAGLIEEVKKLTNAIMGEELVVNIDGREIARGMRKFLKNS